MKQIYSRVPHFIQILTLLLLCSLIARAQAPAWQGVITPTQAYGQNTAYVDATAADANGNVYLLGHFSGTVQFGAITLVKSGPATDRPFVAKWSKASNSFVWSQAINGSSTDFKPRAIAVNGSDVYITGYFTQGTVAFGTTTLTLASPFPAKALFVAKLTDAGSTADFTWAQQSASVGANSSPMSNSIAVAGANVYVAGGLSGTARFGGVSLSTSTPNDVNGDTDGFVVKLTDAGATGSFIWAQQISGAATDVISKVVTGSTGQVFVCGSFGNQATVGSLSLTSVGDADGFVAKLADNGTTGSFTWAQRLGGTGADNAKSLAVSGSAVYLTGEAAQNADFGSIRLDNQTGKQMFAAKLTDAGASSSFTWVQEAYAEPADIAVKGTNVYLTGRTGFPGYFGTIYSPRSGDIYLAKLKDNGSTSNFTWLQTAQGLSLYAFSLAISGADIYVSGVLSLSSATFGTLPPITTSQSWVPLSYLAYLTDNTLLPVQRAERLEAGIYPNPAHTTVQLPTATAATNLTLLDNLGRLVRQGRGTTLSVLGIAPGLYILQAATPGQPMRTARLVVE